MNDLIFSVVIPTYQRPQALAALLKGIGENHFPPGRFEVIVVDDSGSDNLNHVLEPFRQRYPLTSLRTPHLGPAPARQKGVDAAVGKYLVFTDDDCIPNANWLAELLSALEDNPGCAVGGSIVNGLPENVFSSASQVISDYVSNQNARTDIEFLATANVAYPAEGFRIIGGLDRTWHLWGGEDRDLCRRWRDSGRRFIVHPQAKIHHFHPLSFTGFWDQHFRYGRGAGRFHRSTPLARAGFYAGLIAAGFRERGRHTSVTAGCAVLLSQFAIVCGFLYESRRKPHNRLTAIRREPVH